MSLYDKIIEEILPNALMIGVDYDLFWRLSPKSLDPFVKAFSLRQKYDDTFAWSQGRYIQLAIASVMNKNSKYPIKPLFTDKPREMTSEEMFEKMKVQMNVINNRFKKGE